MNASHSFWPGESGAPERAIVVQRCVSGWFRSDEMTLAEAIAQADRASVEVYITKPRQKEPTPDENASRRYRVGWFDDKGRGVSAPMSEEEARRVQQAHRKSDHRRHAVVQEWYGDEED